MNPDVINREEWLKRACALFTPWFAAKSLGLPAKVRVSVGFPSRNALSNRNRAIGQCWQESASKDGVTEIFVSPVLDDPLRVGDVLIHEMCHAAVNERGHKGEFARAAKAMGLAGKMTATHASPELVERLNVALPQLGPYPHGALDPLVLTKDKQTTRLLKAECSGCGYTIRVTQKWIDCGLPTCTPCGCLFEVRS